MSSITPCDCYTGTEMEGNGTSAKELKLCFAAMGSMRALICSQASKTAAPYISELAEAAVGDALGTLFEKKHKHKNNVESIYQQCHHLECK